MQGKINMKKETRPLRRSMAGEKKMRRRNEVEVEVG